MFITFEGGEGSGKSTQARSLFRRLVKEGVPAVLTREPGGTTLGKRLARYLKWGERSLSPTAELLLFDASRAQLVDEAIRPALDRGKWVVCDRYADSTIAYQGYGRGLGLVLVKAANNAATGGLTPDITFLLDMPAEMGLARKAGARSDRFEQEEIAFHRRVREGYLKMAADEPKRWLVIDGTKPKDEIAGIIWEQVSRLLRRKE